MRQAIFSDIHVNLEALQACVEHARRHGAETYACLGDCIGYGAEPAAVMALLQSLPGLLLVRGNHDQALADESAVQASDITQSIEWACRQLTPPQQALLCSAPYVLQQGVATYVHASAHQPEQWEYLYEAGQAEACLQAAGTPLCFIGHVHVPKVFYHTPGSEARELDPVAGATIPLSSGCRYVISVGSVGQPRDGNSAACYVLYDSSAAEVTFYRPGYDYLATAEKIRAAGLSPRFAARLAEGR